MASHIKRGESILIPFRSGQSITDSQLKPRMYKTLQAFEKSFPGHYLGTNGVVLVEYAEVVRCKDCKHREDGLCPMEGVEMYPWFATKNDAFCSYGERREGE